MHTATLYIIYSVVGRPNLRVIYFGGFQKEGHYGPRKSIINRRPLSGHLNIIVIIIIMLVRHKAYTCLLLLYYIRWFLSMWRIWVPSKCRRRRRRRALRHTCSSLGNQVRRRRLEYNIILYICIYVRGTDLFTVVYNAFIYLRRRRRRYVYIGRVVVYML